MNKNILFSILVISILLLAGVSAYICVEDDDVISVKEFKYKVNRLALEQDIESGMTSEGLRLKLKYFTECR